MPTVRDCLASLLLIAIAGITTPPGHATPKGAQAGEAGRSRHTWSA